MGLAVAACAALLAPVWPGGAKAQSPADARPSVETRQPADARPNVLLVTVDTLRADYLGTYGFEYDTSPHIDALAARGVVFERAIAASSRTAPSHASIMTSRYVREHSIAYGNGGSALTERTRLAPLLHEAGYATAAFVGNIVLRKESGLDLGFDVYDDDLPEAEQNRETIFERIAGQTNERALAWLGKLGAAPFFLWVHYQDPHGPYTPPAGFRGRIEIPRSPGEKPLEAVDALGGWNAIPAYQALEGLRWPSQYESRYADEIVYMDHALGELLRAVDSHSSGRETVVLLTADHGESLGESERYFSHGFATTPQLAQVPLVLRAPGLAPARRNEVVSHVDIMPTLLELAGLEVPPDLSGRSLVKLARDGEPPPDRFVYCDIGSEVSAYRKDSFLRVLGTLAAWEEPGQAGMPPALRFTWKDARSWSLAPSQTVDTAAVAEYVSRAVPMKRLHELPSDVRERLKLLGYVEIGER